MHREILQSSETLCSAVGHGVYRELFQKRFNIFSAENVHRSIFADENGSDLLSTKSQTFGFARLMDLSPDEVAFLATGSFMQRLLFSIMRWDRQFLDGFLDLLMESMDHELGDSHPDSGKVRAVTRMLLIPSRADTNLLRRKTAVVPGYSPFDDLVVSHRDRILADVKLLHATYSFIPRARAPPVCPKICPVFSFLYCVRVVDRKNLLTFPYHFLLHRYMSNAQIGILLIK